MSARPKRKAGGDIASRVDKQIAELKKFHRKSGVRVTVLTHKWPRSKKIIIIKGANN